MEYQTIWRSIIIGKEKSWVVFENNTCVILMEPEDDIAHQAKEILKEYGPYFVGTASADMKVTELLNYPGWVVTGHHNDILNYVSTDEFEQNFDNTAVIGILGRENRAKIAEELKVVHIEDKLKKLKNT